MDIEALRSFLVVAEQGNITHAAERLHISQPTLSRRIAALERELGARLVKREHRSVSLTSAGEILQGEAEQIVQHADALPALISSGAKKAALAEEKEDRLSGTLHFAHHKKVDETIMMGMGKVLRDAHPKVAIETMTRAYPTELRNGVKTGRYDVVFFLRPHLHHRSSQPTYVLGTSNFMLMVPGDHPFATKGSVDVSELRDCRAIMLERKVSPEIVDFVNSRFIEAGFSINATHYVHNLEEGIVQVAAGKGVSFCHDMMAENGAFASYDVRLVPITGADFTFDYVMRFSNNLDASLQSALVSAAAKVVEGPIRQV